MNVSLWKLSQPHRVEVKGSVGRTGDTPDHARRKDCENEGFSSISDIMQAEERLRRHQFALPIY